MSKSFKNSFESGIYEEIKARARNHRFYVAYEQDDLHFVLKRRYRTDFTIEFESGHKRYIETKGFLRSGDITKMLAVRQQHPDLDIRIVFQKDNVVIGSRKRYSEWATRVGYPWAIGHVPEEWYVE